MALFKKKFKNTESEELNFRPDQVLNDKTSFAVSEAYKTARTNLQFVSNDDGCNIIAFTSSFPAEGKTMTCVNMSVCLAQNGKKVLLIDSDMRKPQIAVTLGVKKTPGLADLLAGFVKLSNNDENMIRQKTHIPNLDVITAGNTPPNPAELLAGTRFKELIEKLSKEYDYIMIDTPPTLVVTDSLVIRNHVNGYVIVVRSGITGIDIVKETVSKLRQIDAKICGFIINGRKTKGGGKYSRYSKYSKYSRYSRYSRYSKD
jgi:capsular exopolysaccharide synthesis family protein